MYYVNSEKTMAGQVQQALVLFFGDKAEVTIGGISVKVVFKEDAGHPDVRDLLGEEEIKQGVCGGGIVEGLDGRTFYIKIVEIKNS